MRLSLELLRIICVCLLLGGLGWMILETIYETTENAKRYSWLGSIALILLLFALYRNKLQFSGWYKGKNRVKLSKPTTITLVLISLFLMILPLLLGLFGSSID